MVTPTQIKYLTTQDFAAEGASYFPAVTIGGDGVVIEGTQDNLVEINRTTLNSTTLLFSGIKIESGAKIENSILNGESFISEDGVTWLNGQLVVQNGSRVENSSWLRGRVLVDQGAEVNKTNITVFSSGNVLVESAHVIESEVSGKSIISGSGTVVSGSTISRSTIKNDSTISNSGIWDSTVDGSRIENSTSNSSFVVSNSRISGQSSVLRSFVENTDILSKSWIVNSTVRNSTLSNCVLFNDGIPACDCYVNSDGFSVCNYGFIPRLP